MPGLKMLMQTANNLKVYVQWMQKKILDSFQLASKKFCFTLDTRGMLASTLFHYHVVCHHFFFFFFNNKNGGITTDSNNVHMDIYVCVCVCVSIYIYKYIWPLLFFFLINAYLTAVNSCRLLKANHFFTF